MFKSKFTCKEKNNISEESYKEDATINQATIESDQIILSDNDEIDISEENYEDAFIVDQVTFENILNDSDEMDTFEKNYKDTFTINQVTLENVRIILNYDNEIEDINWNENENSI
ncbi:hypothetical protein F8M41_012435 [Gigaspora margarita]|uniref:Uncharacterized protein n=1 Tax=Gigaspora margarita TaxID=4874 RepID=A0A8H3X149_GIGMA|nr:hypothetical protein F8M41_012435 [Gigaspora margarita]